MEKGVSSSGILLCSCISLVVSAHLQQQQQKEQKAEEKRDKQEENFPFPYFERQSEQGNEGQPEQKLELEKKIRPGWA